MALLFSVRLLYLGQFSLRVTLRISSIVLFVAGGQMGDWVFLSSRCPLNPFSTILVQTRLLLFYIDYTGKMEYITSGVYNVLGIYQVRLGHRGECLCQFVN